MTLITEEIGEALKRVSIPTDVFALLPDIEIESLYKELLSTFVSGGDRKWWWESFSRPDYTLCPDDEQGFKKITQLVPNPSEVVWFMAEEDQLPFYPIYQARPSDIQAVIGECYAF